MNSQKTLKLAQAALLLAICIGSQFLKNMSVYITGPIVNICLIICALTAGTGWALVLAVVSPITSFIITGSKIMAAVPEIIPAVMLGNIILVVSIRFAEEIIKNKKISLPVGIGAGVVLKAGFMGVVISLILLPLFLPEQMAPQMKIFQLTFSVTQLITGIIGGILSYIIWIPLKKALSGNIDSANKDK